MQKTILASLLAVAALAPVASFASDGTISFNGAITSQTCTINGGVPNLTVNLPKVSASSLATAGARAAATPIPIVLTNCTAGTTGAYAYFEPSSPNADLTTGRLKIATGAGNATNVQINLLGTDAQTDILLNKPQAATYVPVSGGSANLTYYAQYYATGAATAGSTTSSVQYTIVFQ